MLIVTGKKVTEVTFAAAINTSFLFFRRATLGQSGFKGRNAEVGVRRLSIFPRDLPDTFPSLGLGGAGN